MFKKLIKKKNETKFLTSKIKVRIILVTKKTKLNFLLFIHKSKEQIK